MCWWFALLVGVALGEDVPVASDCSAFTDPDLVKRLDHRTHSEVREGNAVELLVNGVEAFARRIENTKDADIILVKTFIFTEDETGRAVAQLLRERARAGKTVVVQYDQKGSLEGVSQAWTLFDSSSRHRVLRDKPILAGLAQDGVIVVPTNAPRTIPSARRLLKAQARAEAARGQGTDPDWGIGRALTHFDHEKYWITGKIGDDGVPVYRAILGGMNVASEYAFGGTDRVDGGSKRGGWRDTDIEVRGPVTEDIVRRFLDVLGRNVLDWPDGLDRTRWEVPQPVAGTAQARFVWNQPAWGTRGNIARLYRTLLDATPADSVIQLETAYFTPGPRVHQPLVKRLRDGGKLAVLTNSHASTDMGVVATASRGVFASLLEASPEAELYEWRPVPGLTTLHSKIASFGTCGPVVVGSANLDGLSSLRNSESVLVVQDDALRARMDAVFAADFEIADRVTSDVVAETPATERWSQRVVFWLGWRYLSL